jgi:hypothetical protein
MKRNTITAKRESKYDFVSLGTDIEHTRNLKVWQLGRTHHLAVNSNFFLSYTSLPEIHGQVKPSFIS